MTVLFGTVVRGEQVGWPRHEGDWSIDPDEPFRTLGESLHDHFGVGDEIVVIALADYLRLTSEARDA